MLWALAHLRVQPDAAALPVLHEAVARVAPQLAPQELANLMWALASLRIRPAALALLETAVTQVSRLTRMDHFRLVTSLSYASLRESICSIRGSLSLQRGEGCVR